MRIVAVSDTHFMHEQMSIPDGDVLVHCGDALGHGTLAELDKLDRFFATLPHRHKVLIAGNHDWCFERDPDEARRRVTHAHYLQDESLTLDGILFYGSPWQPWFHDWAFNVERGAPLRDIWSRIPDETEVLLTHGPPAGVLDRTIRGADVGCEELLARVEALQPKLHVFGHIHEGYGTAVRDGTLFVNASTCTVRYEPTQPPVVVELGPDGAELAQ